MPAPTLPPTDPTPERPFADRARTFAGEFVRTWMPAFLAVILFRNQLFEPFRIPSGSMVPTLAIGDHIVISKFSYGFRWPFTRIPMTELKNPERGDVVVFVYPGSNTSKLQDVDLPVPPFATYDYVKRVVGLPGDQVEVRANVVVLNGEPQKREYTDSFLFRDDDCRTYETKQYTENLNGVPHVVLQDNTYGMTARDFGPVTVPDGHIFVMGDNRDHSADSRVWGFVPLENIKGKAHFVWMSLERCEENAMGEVRRLNFGSARLERIGEPIR